MKDSDERTGLKASEKRVRIRCWCLRASGSMGGRGAPDAGDAVAAGGFLEAVFLGCCFFTIFHEILCDVLCWFLFDILLKLTMVFSMSSEKLSGILESGYRYIALLSFIGKLSAPRNVYFAF